MSGCVKRVDDKFLKARLVLRADRSSAGILASILQCIVRTEGTSRCRPRMRQTRSGLARRTSLLAPRSALPSRSAWRQLNLKRGYWRGAAKRGDEAMTEQLATASENARARLPMWLQCIVALVGVALLAGPAAAVVWYR